MPVKSSSSPITLVAILLSALVALAVAVYVFIQPRGKSSTTTTAVAPPAPNPQAPNPAPSPIPHSPLPAPSDTETSPPITAAAEGDVRLTGSIKDASGAPAPGAKLYLLPKSAERVRDALRDAQQKNTPPQILTADAGGLYSYTMDARQPYFLGMMLDGEPQPFVQEIRADAGEKTINADFVLPKPFEVRGTVTDENAVPVPGAPVKCSWRVTTLRDAVPTTQNRIIETDTDGLFRIEVSEPAYVSITIDAPKLPAPFLYNKEPILLSREEFRDARTYRVDLQLLTGIDIAGRVVRGGTTAAVEGATVRLLSDNFPTASPKSATTGPDGRFVFNHLLPGPYSLEAEHSSFSPSGKLRAAPGEDATIELFPFAAVTGAIEVPAPVPSGATATVSLLDRYTGQRTESRFGSDVAAPFTIADVKPGVYLLAAELENNGTIWYSERPITVAVSGGGPVGSLTLRPLTAARGKLVGDPPAAGYQSLSVSAQPIDVTDDPFPTGTAKNSWRRLPVSSVSDSGIVTVENLRSDLDYLLLVEDRAAGEILGSALAAPRSAEPVRIALLGVGELSGRVLNQFGEACVGVTVELSTGIGTLEGEGGTLQTRRAATNSRGEYRFPHVPAGQSRLVFAGETTAARLVGITRAKSFTIDSTCRSYVAVELLLTGEPQPPIRDGEQFLVIPQAGTDAGFPVKELQYGPLRAELQPGKYTLTRTSTMESRAFEVAPRLDGEVRIDFGPKPSP